jgi:hypothetical protein
MIRITYLSQATSTLAPDALLALVTQCHRNNPGRGLTGMLLFGNGTFLQSLEGEDAVVDALITKIESDPRHTGMKILRRETISVRQYADWSMGFEQVTDETLAAIPGLRNLGLRDFTAEYLGSHGDVVDTLLERHRAPHWDPLIRELDARDKLIADLRRELTNARNDHQMAALVLDTVIEAVRKGGLDEAHLEICRATSRALR